MASVDKLFAALRDAAAAVAAAPDAGAVRDAALRGSLAVLELKARNRDVYEGVDLRRQATADAKQALEKTNLQLQNLQYEKSHYAKEIRTCRDFRSAFLDSDVGLVPEEEFLRRAPPELKLAADGAADAGHTRMLNRLAFELAERKDLCKLLQELKTHKKALQETNTSRRKLILALATELKAIKAATGPLAKLVAMPDRTAVHLLPAPLRAVFTALDSAPASSGDERRCVVSVLGSSDAGAERPTDVEPGENLKEEEGEEEDESTRRVKRVRSGAPVAHSMSVLLELLRKSGGTLAAVAFDFIPLQNLVVPRVEDGDAALLQGIMGEDALPPRDEEDGGGSAGPVSLHWAQKLAGLDGASDAAHASAVIAALLAAASGEKDTPASL